MKPVDITGQVFGYLVAINPINIGKGRAWRCLCICGRIKVALAGKLNRGEIKSCGHRNFQIGWN